MSDFAELLRIFTADMVVSARLWRKLAREQVARYGVAEAGAGPLLWIGRLGGKVRQNVLAEYCGMEGASLVRRDYEATIPPKVTYSLTQRGHELDDVLGKLAEIGMRWEAEDAALRAARAAELKAAE